MRATDPAKRRCSHASSPQSANRPPGVTAIYARKSRPSDSPFGSCQAQEAICRDTADAFGWEIKEVYADDGGSSETLERPAMTRLIEHIETGAIRRLIVDRADRLARRLSVMAQLMELLERHQVELIVVTDPSFGQSAGGRLASNILAAASEFQLDLTRERMAESRAALKSRGKRVAGPVPFGYRADPSTKQLVQHSEEATVVRDIFKLASDGARPSDIASIANLQSWPNGKGAIGRWSSGRIRDLLNNPVYVGEIRNGDSTLPGEHQAIVTEATFRSVQRYMQQRRTQKKPTRSEQRNAYLRGRVICGRCDRPMSTSTSQRSLGDRAKIQYFYYRCRSESGGRAPCPRVSVGVYQLEQAILRLLVDEESRIPDTFRDNIAELPEAEQLETLPRVIERIVYNHRDGSIQITLQDEAFADRE